MRTPDISRAHGRPRHGRNRPDGTRGERKEICREADDRQMRSGKPWLPKKWHKGDLYALAFLLLGLVMVLSVAATGLRYATWTLWIAVPMIMFSLAYIFLVSALPIFLGPRSGGEPGEGETTEEGRE